MAEEPEKKNAIDKFKERPFRQRVFLFLGVVIVWVSSLLIIAASKKEKETAYSLQVYWISSAFFIFIVFKLMFRRFNQ